MRIVIKIGSTCLPSLSSISRPLPVCVSQANACLCLINVQAFACLCSIHNVSSIIVSSHFPFRTHLLFFRTHCFGLTSLWFLWTHSFRTHSFLFWLTPSFSDSLLPLRTNFLSFPPSTPFHVPMIYAAVLAQDYTERLRLQGFGYRRTSWPRRQVRGPQRFRLA